MSEEIRITSGAAVTVRNKRGRPRRVDRRRKRNKATHWPHPLHCASSFLPSLSPPFLSSPLHGWGGELTFLFFFFFCFNQLPFRSLTLFRGAPVIIISVQILLDTPVVLVFFARTHHTAVAHACQECVFAPCASLGYWGEIFSKGQPWRSLMKIEDCCCFFVFVFC